MIAVDKKTNRPYQVVKFSLKVIEHGSDTDFGKATMMIYIPENRSSISVLRENYTIYDNWTQVSGFKWCEED